MSNNIILEGDTLIGIAMRLGIPVSQLLMLNPGLATGLTVGQEIRLPNTQPAVRGGTPAAGVPLATEGPSTGTNAFFLGQEGFDNAFNTFLGTIADPRIKKFMFGQRNLVRSEYEGRIGQAFLSGKITDPTDASAISAAGLEPLSFLKSINAQERFLSATPFERGEEGFVPTAIRPRRVRF